MQDQDGYGLVIESRQEEPTATRGLKQLKSSMINVSRRWKQSFPVESLREEGIRTRSLQLGIDVFFPWIVDWEIGKLFIILFTQAWRWPKQEAQVRCSMFDVRCSSSSSMEERRREVRWRFSNSLLESFKMRGSFQQPSRTAAQVKTFTSKYGWLFILSRTWWRKISQC